MKRIIAIALLIAAFSLPAMAGTDYNICFMKIDSDYDGEITKSEFASAFPTGDTTIFNAADADKNGTISHDEWEDYKSSQGFEEGDHEDG